MSIMHCSLKLIAKMASLNLQQVHFLPYTSCQPSPPSLSPPTNLLWHVTKNNYWVLPSLQSKDNVWSHQLLSSTIYFKWRNNRTHITICKPWKPNWYSISCQLLNSCESIFFLVLWSPFEQLVKKLKRDNETFTLLPKKLFPLQQWNLLQISLFLMWLHTFEQDTFSTTKWFDSSPIKTLN